MGSSTAASLTKEFLIEQHQKQRKSICRIARETGTDPKSLKRQFELHDIHITNHRRLQECEFDDKKIKPIKIIHKNKSGALVWEFECECGNKFRATIAQVRQRNMESCGCTKANECGSSFGAWKGYFGVSGSIVSHIRSRAKGRKLDFNLTAKYLWGLWLAQNGTCPISGIKLVLDGDASIDRIDSSGGYVEGNVQWVHAHINIMKWDKTEDEFVDWCRMVVNHRDSKTDADTPSKSSFPINKKSDGQNDPETPESDTKSS